MSMNTYELHDYGLLIDETVAAAILIHDEPACETFPDEIKKAIEDNTIWANLESLTDMLPEDYTDIEFAHELLPDSVYCHEFSGTATTIDPSQTEREWSWSDTELVYVELDKVPKLLEKAYESLDEIKAELRKKIANIIPDEFDIHPYIVEISGTYFC